MAGWSRLDDDFHANPKVLHAQRMSFASIGLWPLGLSWSARTDGEVTSDFVQGLIHNRRQRDIVTGALVEAGLWVPNGDGGWQIHDWREYNLTRNEREARKRADRDRKRAGIR